MVKVREKGGIRDLPKLYSEVYTYVGDRHTQIKLSHYFTESRVRQRMTKPVVTKDR